ncbi:MAG: HDOD domain-containing protein [Nitrospirae bacterium]|nr:HDOD domain-containing protein [Nitrospirota bacterium]
MAATQSKILSYIEKIPALSPTISKIINITGNDKSSAADLVQAIKLDPVLTARVLNLINSAYFGMPQKVTSINRAIILLGMNTIKNLALSAEVLSSFNPSRGFSFSVERFWEHSLACAVGCKLIAKNIIEDPIKHEEFFIAGLIHDIGKIFLIKHFPKDYFSMVKKITDANLLTVRERKFFTMDHTEIGAIIGEKWALSTELISSIRHHHNDKYVDPASLMPHIVYLSNLYCKVHGFDDQIGTYSSAAPVDGDWLAIGLSPSMEQEALSMLSVKVDEARIFLQISRKNPGSEETPPGKAPTGGPHRDERR